MATSAATITHLVNISQPSDWPRWLNGNLRHLWSRWRISVLIKPFTDNSPDLYLSCIIRTWNSKILSEIRLTWWQEWWNAYTHTSSWSTLEHILPSRLTPSQNILPSFSLSLFFCTFSVVWNQLVCQSQSVQKKGITKPSQYNTELNFKEISLSTLEAQQIVNQFYLLWCKWKCQLVQWRGKREQWIILNRIIINILNSSSVSLRVEPLKRV